MSNPRLFVTFAALVGIAIPSAWVSSLVMPGEEAIKIRNGFVASLGNPADFNWTPPGTPESFLTNRAPPSPEFVLLASRLASRERGADIRGLELALTMSRHLMGAPQRIGGPIQARLDESYNGIRRGRGYCADFTRVFSGLAVAAGLPVRTWSVSFESFGAGHSFNEIYDQKLAKWVLIDSFHSLYFVDTMTRMPLSVLEVHERLLDLAGTSPNIEIMSIVSGRQPFRSGQLALDYYRRGMPQLALVWGNNVFDYDQSALIRLGATVSRHVERAVAIGTGQFPSLRIYPNGVSHRDVEALFRARNRFMMALGSLTLASIVFGALLVSVWRQSADRLAGNKSAA